MSANLNPVFARTNAELVQRTIQIIRSLGKEMSSVYEARQALSLHAQYSIPWGSAMLPNFVEVFMSVCCDEH